MLRLVHRVTCRPYHAHSAATPSAASRHTNPPCGPWKPAGCHSRRCRLPGAWSQHSPWIPSTIHKSLLNFHQVTIYDIYDYVFNEQSLRSQPVICTFKGWDLRPCLACVDSPSQWTEMRFSTPSVGSTRCLFEPQGSLWSSSGLISPYQ